MAAALALLLALPISVRAETPPVSFAAVQELSVRAPDAVVRYGSRPQQFGELWVPSDQTPRHAGLVIFVHGGCWQNRYDVSHSRALAARLAEQGFSVWSLEYRRLGDPEGGIPGTFADINQATASLDLLNAHGVGTHKTVIAGHSAGGHLALWAAATYPERFAGVLGMAAITDLASYAAGDSACQRSARSLMQGSPTEQPAHYQRYSPSARPPHANTWLIQGARDTIVPASQARALGLPAAQLIMTNGGHFDLIHPDTPDFAAVSRMLLMLLQ